jgi:hypothetical protein
MVTKAKEYVFYVYMHNNTDHRDDEVFKVRARDKKHAKEVAASKMRWPGRCTVGWVKGAREKGLADYKWWATDHT